MLLETFQNKLRAAGRTEQEIDEITFNLSGEFPELFLHYEMKPMSTGMDAIDLPEEVIERYVSPDDSEANPRKAGIRRIGPFYFEVTDQEKEKIRDLVIENAGDAGTDPAFMERLEEALADRVRLTIPDKNSKLGKIQNFSLPVGQPERAGSCIGASKECEAVCYLTGGFVIDEETGKERPAALGYLRNQVPHHVNYAIVKLFPDRWVKAMEKYIIDPIFRIHVGGDFFSAKYVKTWTKLAKRRRDVRFFAYTRSWQDGTGKIRDEMLPSLIEFSEQENCRLLLSCDEDTGVPEVGLIPAAVRAWMAVNDNEPKIPVELIFRDKSHLKSAILSYNVTNRYLIQGKGDPEKLEERLANLRTEMGKGIRGFFVIKGKRVPVCPIEINPFYIKKSGEMSCQTCGWCFSFLHVAAGVVEEQKLGEISKLTGKDAEKTIRSLGRFQSSRTAANPPVCLECFGDCECMKCSCGSCPLHWTCTCCCGCEVEVQEEETEECGCDENCNCDPCDCEGCPSCDFCIGCCCACGQ